MIDFELGGHIGVCTDCMLDHANGEISPDRDASQPQPWAKWQGIGYRVTMGGQHNEECPNRDSVSSQEECDCDNLGFSYASCEGCGSNLGGDRYAFTYWVATREYARHRHAMAIGAARQWRLAGEPIGHARELLADAATWRAYLSGRLAEDRRYASWRASLAD